MDAPQSLLPEIAAFLRRGKHVEKVPVPTVKELPTALRDVAEQLPAITGTWNPVEIYTADPKNRREEQSKFLHAFVRGRVYQPKFTYEYAEKFELGNSRTTLLSMLEQVRQCSVQDRGNKMMKLMFYYKIKDDLATCDLVEGIQRKDEKQIATALQYKYPGVDPVILDIAEQDFQHRITHRSEAKPGELSDEDRTSLHEMTFDAQAVKEAFEWALHEYGILQTEDNPTGYKVVVDRRATAIDVRDKSALGPTVYVPETAREDGEHLLGLIAHEIEGHARQSWNGERLFIFGGGPLKIDEETLYEGLAMRYEIEFRQKYFGNSAPSYNPDYYVFGVREAEKGGTFYDVFRDQLDKRLRMMLKIPLQSSFSYSQVKEKDLLDRAMERAWGSTYRVMRGHVNMENPLHFAMAKDLAYFRGWVLDHQLHAEGHGHINEASICSIGQLRVLAEFDIRTDHLAAPFKDVTTQYMKMLLEHKKPHGGFVAKRR